MKGVIPRTLSATLLLLAAITATARAENWPRFRGPTGQGVSAERNVPVRWTDTKNVAWKTPIPGHGWSSPIVWEDRVFLTYASEDGSSCHVISLDAKSGKILWDKEVFRQKVSRKEGKNSYATPTPVTDGQRVYAFFNSGSAAAVTFDGQVAWVNQENEFYSRHGLGASPILHEDLVILPFDWSNPDLSDEKLGWQKPWDRSFVLALDRNTGKERWKAKRGLSRIAHVTPQVAEVGGKPQLISGAGDVVQGFDLATGERLWTVYSQGEGVVPSVVIGDGLAFTSSGFEAETIRAVRLDPNAKGDVTKTHIAWELKRAVPVMPSFMYVKDMGLLFTLKENGIGLCIEAKTGKVVWQERLEGFYSASPVLAEGRIYYLAEDGTTRVIQAARELKILAENPIGETCQASPAVSNGRIFIRSDKHLFCIGGAGTAPAAAAR